jgi:hypothetical protein
MPAGYFADTIGFDVQAGMALNINSDKDLESTNLSGGLAVRNWRVLLL